MIVLCHFSCCCGTIIYYCIVFFISVERAVLATGQRGCTVLLYNNEKFVRNRRSSTRTYWICSRKVGHPASAKWQQLVIMFSFFIFSSLQDITICRARIVTTRDENGHEIIVQRSFEHDHTRKFPVRKSGKINKLDENQALIYSPDKKINLPKIKLMKPPID